MLIETLTIGVVHFTSSAALRLLRLAGVAIFQDIRINHEQDFCR